MRAVPTGDFLDSAAQASPGWLAAALGTQLAVQIARALRWQVLLADRVGFAPLFWGGAVGFLANNLLPFRAGEAVRAVVVSRRTGLSVFRVGASVVVERAADVVAVLGIVACLMLSMPIPQAFLISAAVLLVGAACTVGAVAVSPNIIARVHVLSFLPTSFRRALADRAVEVGEAVRELGPRRVVSVLAWSAIIWVASIGGFWSVIEAVAPGSSLVEPSFAVATVSLGVSVPSSPGSVGVFELIGQQGLLFVSPERYTPASALAAVVLAHMVFYVIVGVTGAIGLIYFGNGLRLGAPPERVAPPPITDSGIPRG